MYDGAHICFIKRGLTVDFVLSLPFSLWNAKVTHLRQKMLSNSSKACDFRSSVASLLPCSGASRRRVQSEVRAHLPYVFMLCC